MNKKEFLQLPIEERRKILAAQADKLVEHYEQIPDDMDLQAEMHMQRQTVERLEHERDQLKQKLADEKQLVQGLEGNLAACEKELEETEGKLLACEASRERMRKALVVASVFEAYDSESKKNYPFSRSLAYQEAIKNESPQTALTEALKGVRESMRRASVLAQIASDWNLGTDGKVEIDNVWISCNALEAEFKQRLSELDKLSGK